MKHEKELTTPEETTAKKPRVPFFAKELDEKSLRVKSAIKAGEMENKNAGP